MRQNHARNGDLIVLLSIPSSKDFALPADASARSDLKSRVESTAYQVAAFVESTYGVELSKITFKVEFGEGSAGEAICKKAAELNAGLVVVGSRGLGAIKVGSPKDSVDWK